MTVCDKYSVLARQPPPPPPAQPQPTPTANPPAGRPACTPRGYIGRIPDVLDYRLAGSEDVEAIVKLVDSAYRGEPSRAGWTTEADLLAGQRTDAEAVREIIADNTNRLILAEAGGELVGCCRIQQEGAGRAYLGMFAVMPERQGAGIGHSLLVEAEGFAVQEWEVNEIRMTVIAQRADLIGWYERRGYRRSGESEPFPYGNERFGIPLRPDLHFAVLVKSLAKSPSTDGPEPPLGT